MKLIIFLIVLGFSSVLHGQGHKRNPVSKWQPIYFLDSGKIEITKTYFNMDKIAKIDVVNNYYDSAKQIHGKLFITSKEPKDFSFLSIADITDRYGKKIEAPIIFMLNNEFLKDTSSIKIDSSYILKVEFLKAKEIDYLKNTLPNFTIFKILTKTKENIDKQNQIRIRGMETTSQF